jgi:hypothetical protein
LGQQFKNEPKDCKYTINSDTFWFVDAKSSAMNHDKHHHHMCIHMCNDPSFHVNSIRRKKKAAEEGYYIFVQRDLLVIAKKNIAKGDELFLDYNGSYYRNSLGAGTSFRNVAPSSTKSKLEMLGKARARNHASRPTFAHQPTSKLT